jgi:hypothetical protein
VDLLFLGWIDQQPEEVEMDEILCEINLDLNGEALQELSGEDQVAYQDVRVWGRVNHLAVHRGPLSHRPLDFGRRVVWEIPLRCLVHPHPQCRFRYVRLSVDLRQASDGSPQTDVRVEDLSPRIVEGRDPIRIMTKRAGDLSFALESVGVGATTSAEVSREAQIYFPVVRGSKIVPQLAVWDFEPLPEAPLYMDRDLRLLVSGPSAPSSELYAEFRVEARLNVEGLRGLVPLIGRRAVELTAGHRLN